MEEEVMVLVAPVRGEVAYQAKVVEVVWDLVKVGEEDEPEQAQSEVEVETSGEVVAVAEVSVAADLEEEGKVMVVVDLGAVEVAEVA